MADRKLAYVAAGNLTITLASLASSSTLAAGRVATQTDNSSAKYLDYLLSGFITIGTSPGASTSIEVWVIPETDDTTLPNSLSATDAAYTATTRQILIQEGALAWSALVPATNDQTQYIRKTSIAGLFGGVCPRKFSVFVTQNTGQNLNATGGNHQLTLQGIYETIA